MNISIDNTLYHYTSLNTFMRYILPSKQLKLCKIMDSRDPYEYQAFSIRIIDDDPLQNNIGFLDFLKAAKELKLNSQYLCFCKPESKHIESYYYTRWGYDKPKMWELYGDKHQGVSIALDKEKILFEYNKKLNNLHDGHITHDAISYKDIVCRSDEFKPKTLANYYRDVRHFDQIEFLEEFKHPFFFQKDRDYQDENEYRFVYITSKIQDDLRVDIANSVTALYFGDKVDVDFIKYYKKLITKEFPNIHIYQVRWFNGTVYLNVHNN